jgi:hypothetical protein
MNLSFINYRGFLFLKDFYCLKNQVKDLWRETDFNLTMMQRKVEGVWNFLARVYVGLINMIPVLLEIFVRVK